MKTLLSIVKILFGVILLILVITFFLPSKVHVERTGIVKSSPETAFQLINNLQDWTQWSPWHRLDPNMKITYGPSKEGKGSYYEWTSEHDQVGNGKMTIAETKPVEYIKTEMNFMENGVATGEFFLRPVEGGTEVKWTMDSDMGMNPIGKLMGLFMDKWVGGDYERGLHYLDSVSQLQKPAATKMELEMGRVESLKLMLVKGTATEAEVGKTLEGIFGRLGELAVKEGIAITGVPVAIYEDPSNGTYAFEAGFPISSKPSKALPADVIYKETPASEAAICHFKGNPKSTPEAYQKMIGLIKEKGKAMAASPMEKYLSDGDENSADMEIDIIWPVQ
jgi:effector-binding domain-containing protein